MNPVLILTHNCLDLTKKCIASVLSQDIPVTTVVYDNGSTDGTGEYLNDMLGQVGSVSYAENIGVSAAWNRGLEGFFEDFDHVLVINNDVILGKTFYSQLLSCDVPFVSGTETTDISDIDKEWPSVPFGGGPQFSAFLIRKKAWKIIGPFDERMWGWAGDCDYHIRAHRLGIPLQCSPIRYYHERSSTMKNSPIKERRQMQLQADADRETFIEIYGCSPDNPKGYSALFK